MDPKLAALLQRRKKQQDDDGDAGFYMKDDDMPPPPKPPRSQVSTPWTGARARLELLLLLWPRFFVLACLRRI
jgi:hypothetical protein